MYNSRYHYAAPNRRCYIRRDTHLMERRELRLMTPLLQSQIAVMCRQFS